MLGCTFHTSAILYVLLTFFVNRRKINDYILFSLFIIANAVYFLQIDIISVAINALTKVLPPGLGKMYDLLVRYQKVKAAGITIGFIERFFTFFVFFLNSMKIYQADTGHIFNSFYLRYYFMFLFLAPLSTICERIGVLFSFSYWYLYPYIYINMERKNEKYVFVILFVLYSVFKLYTLNNIELHKYELINLFS